MLKLNSTQLKKKEFCILWNQFHWILTKNKVWNYLFQFMQFFNEFSIARQCKQRRYTWSKTDAAADITTRVFAWFKVPSESMND